MVSKTRGWGFDALRPCQSRAAWRGTSRPKQRALPIGCDKAPGVRSENHGESSPQPVETVSTGADKAKLAVAGLLVVGAVVAFYALGKQDLWLRVVALLVLMIAAVGVFFTSEPGKAADRLRPATRSREVKKVVWPTRKEAMQMTGYVFAFVVRHGAVPVADRQDARVGAVRPDPGLEALKETSTE